MTGKCIEYIRNKWKNINTSLNVYTMRAYSYSWLYAVLWNRVMLVVPSAGLPTHKLNLAMLIKPNQTYVSVKNYFFVYEHFMMII